MVCTIGKLKKMNSRKRKKKSPCFVTRHEKLNFAAFKLLTKPVFLTSVIVA